MQLYIGISLLFIVAYFFLIFYIIKNWSAQESFATTSLQESSATYTILIPVRNEAENISKCLDSILENQNFDSFNLEIIVIDDFSTDNTIQLVSSYDNVKLLELSKHKSTTQIAFKKAALNLGLSKAKGDYIIQFDGDVIVNKKFLVTIDAFIQKHFPRFIACPVGFIDHGDWFSRFQALDFLGMMMLTQAGIKSSKWYMANGAAMVYKRKNMIFSENNFSSGDDIYTIQKLAKRDNSRIHFLKSEDAEVLTFPCSGFNAFYNQRVRWATKNKYMDIKMLMMMAVPFINALVLLFHLLLTPILGANMIFIFVGHFLVIAIIDFIYLRIGTAFFKRKHLLHSFLISKFTHWFYLCTIGLLSLFVRKFDWKGRQVQ